ncbi:hypothetical protein [Methanogenium cariaci]|uniref:hypothetical protein n=1 Tax=Methanogenium cariaci TaxID=2197 RepID=UPI000781949D|nr:hypothetical protein [Methanogenium cariaci]
MSSSSNPPQEPILVIHRVIAVENGTIRTRGDNNSRKDTYLLTQADIRGGRVVSGTRGGKNGCGCITEHGGGGCRPDTTGRPNRCSGAVATSSNPATRFCPNTGSSADGRADGSKSGSPRMNGPRAGNSMPASAAGRLHTVRREVMHGASTRLPDGY